MDGMFRNDHSFNQSLNNWNVSKVTNMMYMFQGATTFNQNISNWDVSSVNDMSYMFSGSIAFNQSVDNWNVSSVTDTSGMFDGATAFNQPLNNWNVSNVINMYQMFDGASAFNQPIGNWTVSSVNTMDGMFDGATIFNQNISSWDVSSVNTMDGMFDGATIFNQNISSWDVSSVQIMDGMFDGATIFNQNISSWDVSSVTDTSGMFDGATAFNQNISSWDVSSVTTMYQIFCDASAFNQDISSWDVLNVQNMYYMFHGASAFSTENYGALLIGWSKLNLYHGVTFSARSTQYPASAATAHDYIHIHYGWSITDGGLASATTPMLSPISSPSTTGNVTLDWSSSLTASSYSVYRSNSAITSLTGATMIATNITTNTYEDTNLANGTYYYVILATNGVMNASISNCESVSVISIPSGPTNLNAAAEASSIYLTWTASTNNGGSTNLYYDVYRADSVNGPFISIKNSTTTSYNDTNAVVGQTYHYEVSAFNEAGESGFSNIVSTTIILTPSAPTNLIATTKTSSILLTWTASTNNGASTNLYYNVYRADSVNGPFISIKNSTTTSYNDTNAVVGQTNHYEVSAFNEAGESGFSNIVSTTIILTPSAPTNLIATTKTSSILLTWTASTNNGASTNLYYNVYRADSANGTFTLIGNSTTTSYNDTNVTAGQTYYYKVSAINSAGASGYSNIVNATISSSSTTHKSINGMGITEILSFSFIGVLAVTITMKKRKNA